MGDSDLDSPLCHTCHSGLDPHEDYLLFNYLSKEGANSRQDLLRNFLKRVTNYRKAGFFASLNETTSGDTEKRRRRSKQRKNCAKGA
jgi:hypothetical protein